MNGEDASLRPVARAIERMVTAGPSGLSLTALAEEAGLSAGHFQRLFKRGVGVSPKRFQQALALVEARRLLDDDRTVLDAALAAGLSGPGRLHDLFVACEGMTPGEWRRGEGVTVRHGLSESPFGIALVGWTDVGVCWLSLGAERELDAMRGELRETWPRAVMVEDTHGAQEVARRAFAFAAGAKDEGLTLDVRGTNFQMKVWEALLRIPPGSVVSYGDVARAVGQPSASRAVGAAVGANPVSVLIPCHRVIQRSGVIHRYRWGAERKRSLLAWERARGSMEEDMVGGR